jgi:hypothetical protein
MAKSERKHTAKMMLATRNLLRGAEVIKHADRFTKGVPDVTSSWMGATYWLEDKWLQAGQHYKDIIDVAQMMRCHSLATTTNGKCWYVVFEESPNRTSIWTPVTLARACGQFFPILSPKRGALLEPIEGVRVFNSTVGQHRILQSSGMIHTAGYDYEFPARVIYEATISGS